MIERLTRFNLKQWLAESKDLPGTKKCIWESSDFWAFVTWGPNERTEFHINPGDEMFQQLKGRLDLCYMDSDGEPKIAVLEPGDLFFVPGGTPHSPRRQAGSWTLVLTPRRTPGAQERWCWYCDNCHAKLHEVGISGRQMGEPVEELNEAVCALKQNRKLRTCPGCGYCSKI